MLKWIHNYYRRYPLTVFAFVLLIYSLAGWLGMKLGAAQERRNIEIRKQMEKHHGKDEKPEAGREAERDDGNR